MTGESAPPAVDATRAGVAAAARSASPLDRTLVIRFGRVGDMLVVTPVLRALRQAHPAMHIHVLTTAEGRAVLAANPHVEAVHVLRMRRPPRWLNPELAALERRLVALRFDDVVLLEGADRYRDLASRLGAPRVWSYARPGHAAALHEAVRGAGHELHNSFAVLERMGVQPAGAHYDFAVSDGAVQRASLLLQRHGIGERCLIGVHPGFHQRRLRRRALPHAKAWPLERWVAVIERLAGPGRAIMLTGTRREHKRNAGIVARVANARVTDLAGETDLEGLAAILARCAVFIAPDTGPGHLAAAVRTPLVALFGPKPPAIMGPLGDESRIVRLYPEPSTAPPQERLGHHPRMWAITVDDVVTAAERMLGAHAGLAGEENRASADRGVSA